MKKNTGFIYFELSESSISWHTSEMRLQYNIIIEVTTDQVRSLQRAWSSWSPLCGKTKTAPRTVGCRGADPRRLPVLVPLLKIDDILGYDSIVDWHVSERECASIRDMKLQIN